MGRKFSVKMRMESNRVKCMNDSKKKKKKIDKLSCLFTDKDLVLLNQIFYRKKNNIKLTGDCMKALLLLN